MHTQRTIDYMLLTQSGPSSLAAELASHAAGHLSDETGRVPQRTGFSINTELGGGQDPHQVP